MRTTPLPGRAGQHCGDRVAQPVMAVGGDQLHAGQAAGGQPAQERQPARAILGRGDVQAEDLPLASAFTPVAISACTFTVRPPSRTFWVSASIHTNTYGPASSGTGSRPPSHPAHRP
jgi:hypothetical protein